MQKLVCEVCGSSNLLKEDGVYCCQSCGTKFSPEEAKKIMIEGTAMLDDGLRVENLKKLAKNFLENDIERSLYYRDELIEADPDNWKEIAELLLEDLNFVYETARRNKMSREDIISLVGIYLEKIRRIDPNNEGIKPYLKKIQDCELKIEYERLAEEKRVALEKKMQREAILHEKSAEKRRAELEEEKNEKDKAKANKYSCLSMLLVVFAPLSFIGIIGGFGFDGIYIVVITIILVTLIVLVYMSKI